MSLFLTRIVISRWKKDRMKYVHKQLVLLRNLLRYLSLNLFSCKYPKFLTYKIQNSTNNENRKSYYKQQELIYMDYFFYFLVFVYIVILIISCVTMYRKTEMNIAKKVGILGFLFFLPIFSTKILIIILFLMQSFNKNFPKDIHVSKIKLTDLNN